MPLEQKITEFFDRIAQRANEKKLPTALKDCIQEPDLISIYNYIMKNQANLAKKLALGNACRLDKKNTKLSRTLNFIFDFQPQSISLILETKNKSKDSTKIHGKNKEFFLHGLNKTKPAWVIDEAIPRKIANTVFYLESETDFLKIKKEADIPRRLITTYPGSQAFLNTGVFGQSFYANDFQKISFYHLWPYGKNLSNFLKTSRCHLLSSMQLDKIAIQLIQAIKVLHDAGVVYQDLKTESVLVARDQTGAYCFKLSNFKQAYEPSSPELNNKAVANPWYESPEIAVIKKLLNKDEKISGYGAELIEGMLAQAEYVNPHANGTKIRY